ncbi:MAG: thioredoxin family protein [Gammaproteobacteria bacterium]|nr:thioredoxin family protein [Gammaproteobacteria bacterium]
MLINTYRNRLFFFTLCFMFISSSFAAPTKNPEEHFFDSTFGDFSEELQTAKEEGKKGILIFFEMDECPFCHWMKTNVLNQEEVQKYYKDNFLIFAVDIEGDVEMTNFQGKAMTQKDFAFKENRVRATPVIAFFDLQGKRVMRFTGRTGSKEEFLLLGQFVVDKEYEKTKFSKYKRAHKSKKAQ